MAFEWRSCVASLPRICILQLHFVCVWKIHGAPVPCSPFSRGQDGEAAPLAGSVGEAEADGARGGWWLLRRGFGVRFWHQCYYWAFGVNSFVHRGTLSEEESAQSRGSDNPHTPVNCAAHWAVPETAAPSSTVQEGTALLPPLHAPPRASLRQPRGKACTGRSEPIAAEECLMGAEPHGTVSGQLQVVPVRACRLLLKGTEVAPPVTVSDPLQQAVGWLIHKGT